MSTPDRYSRQRRFTGIGPDGQRRLQNATALVVGCGALGTHAIDALARAGVGRLVVVDRDVVELSNLQRQSLFREADAEAGTPKAIAVAERIREVNREVHVDAHVAQCSAAWLAGLGVRPDVVLDGADNFATRYLINDWCRNVRLPWVYAGAVAGEAAAMVVRSDGPCLRCVWPETEQPADAATCETRGILTAAIQAVSGFQVAEALKLMVGAPTTAGVFTCDVWRGVYQVVGIATEPAPDCPVCARGERPALDRQSVGAVTLCGRDAVQVEPPPGRLLDLGRFATRLRDVAADVVVTPHLVRFRADGARFSVFPGGRALVFGVQDPLRAQALYDRWIGS
ncbi:MAG: thiazole biosynthesis adenylyltransferase ThiF [Planctomycetes bacterium]|nr:thiazole biosynthesis adenylyltransferase ThiF [Planctomycetota bacterium]